MSLVECLDRKWYPGVQDFWDDKVLFDFLHRHIKPSDRLLDYGAGAGILGHMNFRGCCDEVIGVDFDERVVENPLLDSGVVMSNHVIPFEENSFDIVMMNNVGEHLEDPVSCLNEIHRVLKPGGLLAFKTPNRFHYIAVVASITPLWFHKWYNALRDRDRDDTFPTFYRFNTREKINSSLQLCGFSCVQLNIYESRPEYLRLNAFIYIFGYFYERIVNLHPMFERYRSVIIGGAKKINSER